VKPNNLILSTHGRRGGNGGHVAHDGDDGDGWGDGGAVEAAAPQEAQACQGLQVA